MTLTYTFIFWIAPDVSIKSEAEILYLGVLIVEYFTISIKNYFWNFMGRETSWNKDLPMIIWPKF